jgi:hypothetical protein
MTEREQNCISERVWMNYRRQKKEKMLENEKHWNNPTIYEYNIVYCIVICWVLGKYNDREWVSNGEVNLIKARYIQAWRVYQYTLFKNEGQEGKTGLFWGWYQWEVGGHKERVNEGEYDGCILYSYMKTEEWNLYTC